MERNARYVYMVVGVVQECNVLWLLCNAMGAVQELMLWGACFGRQGYGHCCRVQEGHVQQYILLESNIMKLCGKEMVIIMSTLNH